MFILSITYVLKSDYSGKMEGDIKFSEKMRVNGLTISDLAKHLPDSYKDDDKWYCKIQNQINEMYRRMTYSDSPENFNVKPLEDECYKRIIDILKENSAAREDAFTAAIRVVPGTRL